MIGHSDQDAVYCLKNPDKVLEIINEIEDCRASEDELGGFNLE